MCIQEIASIFLRWEKRWIRWLSKGYKENQEENKPALGDRVVPQDQNPFADYNPMNSSFDNAFKDDKKDNNNGPFGGMF